MNDIGSIFKEFNDLFGGILGKCPEPPKHLPLRILGLSGSPLPDEIRKAYRAKLLETHPDLRPAFDNSEYQEMAEKGRGDLPDVQELVWARDCALKHAPEPKPVTGNQGIMMEPLTNVTSTPYKPRKTFKSKQGEPQVCRFCGEEIKPIRIYQKGRYWGQSVYCDSCMEKEKQKVKNWNWDKHYKHCAFCNVWFGNSGFQIIKYCNRDCAVSAETARQRKARERRRSNIVCLECGEKFTPKRRDAKYCKAICKQRAFRKRQDIKLVDSISQLRDTA